MITNDNYHPSIVIHIDLKCPDANQTPLLRLLKKKGASFSTTSIAAPAMMPVFKPQNGETEAFGDGVFMSFPSEQCPAEIGRYLQHQITPSIQTVTFHDFP